MTNEATTAEDLLAFVAGRPFQPSSPIRRGGSRTAPARWRPSTGGSAATNHGARRDQRAAGRRLVMEPAHLYLWVPNALLPDGLAVMAAWGFAYKTKLVWHKVRTDGGSDGRGVGFYFRNVTEDSAVRRARQGSPHLAPGRRQTNLIATRKREHSRKPDELYPIIEACSPGPFLELFARGSRPGWTSWGLEVDRPGLPIAAE